MTMADDEHVALCGVEKAPDVVRAVMIGIAPSMSEPGDACHMATRTPSIEADQDAGRERMKCFVLPETIPSEAAIAPP